MVQLTPRALGFGEILDGSFSLYRRNFATFFLVALLPQAPLVLYWLVVAAFGIGGAGGGALVPVTQVLAFPYSVFAGVLVSAGLIHVVGVASTGETPGAVDSLRAGLSRWLPVFLGTLLCGIMILWGFILFIIPGLFLIALLFAVLPTIVLEGRGPLEAIGRSRELSRGGRLGILGTLFIAWLITLIPAMAMWGVAGIALGVVTIVSGDLQALEGLARFEGFAQSLGTIVSAITWPFFMGVLVLVYLDRRARTEAPDLEAAADQLRTWS